MRRSVSVLPAARALVAAIALWGAAGCDAGKEPFLKAAEAEEKGDYEAATPLYEDVCSKKSPLCEAAKKRQARMSIKRAWQLVGASRYKDAKAALDAAKDSPDGTTAGEAAALLAVPELVQGVLYEDAVAQADKSAALATMESIASEPSVVAARATEWIQKNRPALVLAQLKVACAPGGAASGSCAELGKKLQDKHPESAESKEAAALMAESYKRVHPRLKELENLLIQRVMVFDKEQKLEACKAVGNSDEECADRATAVQVPALGYLEGFWKDKLSGVEDPYYKKQFEERWSKAALGEYDPEPWPKP